jgi:hypothetical protein
MPKSTKYSHEQAAKLIAKHHGYILLGQYQRSDKNVLVRCETHGFEKEVRPKHLFAGALMACCCQANSAARGRLLTGKENPFYGKRHTPETIEALRLAKTGAPGHPMSESHKEALRVALTGKPRPESVRIKVRDGVILRHNDFDYCLAKARNGKTAGKPGWFYVARIEGGLKFGSTAAGVGYRERCLKQQFGPEATVVLACRVSDCGAYEAAMMEAHRQHWIRSEEFHDFLSVNV